MNLLSFFISSLIIVLIPGTGVIYTISTGITKGKRDSAFAAIGCTAGIIPHLCLSLALSSLLLQMGSRVFNLVKIMGALYLLYLGFGMIADKSKLSFDGSKNESYAFQIIKRGILINLLNPKLTIFFFSFLPQYITSGKGSYVKQGLMLGIAFMLLTLLIFLCYGILAGSVKQFIEKTPRTIHILQTCFGAIFVIFAIQLGFSSL